MLKVRGVSIAVIALAAWAGSAMAEVRTLLDSKVAGPTVLVIDRPGKDEISAAMAMRQVSTWELTKGKVVVATGDDVAKAAANLKPDAVVVMTVSSKAGTETALATRGLDGQVLVKKLNGLVDDNEKSLTFKEGMPEEVGDAKKVVSLSFLFKSGEPLAGTRTSMLRHAIHEVLSSEGMTATGPWKLIADKSEKIKVAIWSGGGSGSSGLFSYPQSLDKDSKTIDYTYVGPAELDRPGMLDQFDVVVFCGGTGGGQAKAIGEAGTKAVQEFVRKGGGYVSSCAGSYLATSGYQWSLKLVDADTVDSKHWKRGTGPVDIELTEEGKKILGNYAGLVSVKYANGPLLGPAKDSGGLKPYTVLAHFRSDMAKGVPGGVMPNTPAIIAGDYGDGRVLCFSPHPEYVENLQGMIARAVRWAAKKPVE